ncbi:MAG: hypothetical protein WC121_14185 [Candidatus Kapaibacterium sp.]
MKLFFIENLSGKNYYFRTKTDLRNYFINDGDLLYEVLERYKIIELEDYEFDNLQDNRDNLIYGVNLISEINLRQLYNFNYLLKSANFKAVIKKFIDDTGITDEQINQSVIFALKKRLLVRSRSLPNLLRALEVDDSILKYFLLKRLRKNKNN